MCSCASACLWRSEDNLGCPPSWSVLFEMDSLVCCSIGHIPWTPSVWDSLLFPPPSCQKSGRTTKACFQLLHGLAGVQPPFNCVRLIDKVNYFLFAGGGGHTTSGMIMCGSLLPMTHASRNTNLEGASKFKGMMLINCLEPNCTNCPKSYLSVSVPLQGNVREGSGTVTSQLHQAGSVQLAC